MAHPQRVGVHAQHGAGLLGGLPVRHLCGRAVDDHRMHAETRCRTCPRRLGARRVVEEHRVRQLAGQYVDAGPGTIELLEPSRDGEEGVELGRRPVVGGQQAATMQRAQPRGIEQVHESTMPPKVTSGKGRAARAVGSSDPFTRNSHESASRD